MLKLEHVAAGYGINQILFDVSAMFLPGTITSIIGPNGSGKTTLLRIAAGLIKPTDGSIWIKEKAATELASKERARIISYMPQQRPIPDMSVGLFLSMSRYPYRKFGNANSDKDKQIVNAVLEQTGLMPLKEQNMRSLSGGERQKVFLASAMTQGTDIWLLDEPCTHLDLKNQLDLLNEIRYARNNGNTIVAVFHDLLQAFSISDRIYVINKGAIAGCGEPRQLLKSDIIYDIFSVRIRADSTDSLFGFQLVR